ncbi:hypothetical protein J6590_089650 [Homalodisca vitripennis]|nr:hypothetical protein J6590_078439 [Homalodisca vitripennis]KAG8251014.1 hypothetical protein J6590_089650 [Homalodisca vitripennis]
MGYGRKRSENGTSNIEQLLYYLNINFSFRLVQHLKSEAITDLITGMSEEVKKAVGGEET